MPWPISSYDRKIAVTTVKGENIGFDVRRGNGFFLFVENLFDIRPKYTESRFEQSKLSPPVA